MRKLIENSVPGVVLILLAILGFAFDIVDTLGLDGVPAKIAEGVMMILTLMGVRDLMLSEKQKIFTLIADWKSKTFWGTILSVIQPIFMTPEILPGIPDALTQVLYYMGVVMGSIGLIEAGKRGKFGNGRAV